MFNYTSFLSGTQTWFGAGVFVATLALVSFTSNEEPGIGIISEPRTEDAEKLFEAQLKEMLYVEERMTAKLGELVPMAKHPALKQAMEQHRKETASQADRLKKIMGSAPSTRTEMRSAGFDGITEDNDRLMSQFKGSPVSDQVLIAGARRVEHFEMSCYMNLVATAKAAGKDEYVSLLKESLREEQGTDQKLGRLLEEVQNDPEGARERKPDTAPAPVQRQIPDKR